MRIVCTALVTTALYTALAAGANAADVAAPDIAALATGAIATLVPAPAPSEPVEAVLLTAEDGETPLSDYRGRWVLLNFWATWCAPCREEMPAFDRLEAAYGGDRFAVVPVATGRNAIPAIRRFYAEAGVASLPILRDPGQDLAARMGIFGLPATLLLDPEGRVVARMTGPADWFSPEAQALAAALAGAP
jgi:thiol-disulfide isomerase/thioredoxin